MAVVAVDPRAAVNVATPKFAAMAIRKAFDSGWKPTHFLNNVGASVGSVLTPAGLEELRTVHNSAGVARAIAEGVVDLLEERPRLPRLAVPGLVCVAGRAAGGGPQVPVGVAADAVGDPLEAHFGPERSIERSGAERAGVQRATVYSHFPGDGELFGACSAYWRARAG